MCNPNSKDVISVAVIGAGISGVVTAKCCKDENIDYVVFEASDEVGGLWTYSEDRYGVMKFTHINVSKYNYCFSDYPFPEGTTDFPSNAIMSKYVNDYVDHNDIRKSIRFQTIVKSLVHHKEQDYYAIDTVTGAGTPNETKKTYYARHVAIASGHHAKPVHPTFAGQDKFKGEYLHAVKYKDSEVNHVRGKDVTIIGIGNSAVDVAVNCATSGAKSVTLSTRSGAWVLPNYILGHPTDLYASRVLLSLPWQVTSSILENLVTLIDGNQANWGIKPKMRAMQSQPTVSRTLLHHIQRDQIKVQPNVERLDKDTVYFDNGESTKADMLIACTGYRIDLPYLHEDLKAGIKEGENDVFLYKNVFSPTVGPSLAFIGFVQPASGGILPMSEIQARWLCAIVKRKVTLPPVDHMVADIHKEQYATQQRYFKSARHTIQRDPIIYCEQIARMLGTQPRLWQHPMLAMRLLLGSGGTFQWRLDGPGKWDGAAEAIKDVPLPELTTYGLAVVLLLIVSLPITLPIALIMALALYIVHLVQDNCVGASNQMKHVTAEPMKKRQ